MDHLPECQPRIRYEVFSSNGYRCETCDSLRQAEQRGMLMQSAVEADTAVINQNRSYDKGYAAGVQAALDAVAGLTQRWHDERWTIPAADALAAIDALRGE